VLLEFLLRLIQWQVSFDFGSQSGRYPFRLRFFWGCFDTDLFRPVTLWFMLCRPASTLFERQSDREGSRIKTIWCLAALALSPVAVRFPGFLQLGAV